MSRPTVLVMCSLDAPGFPDVFLRLAESFVERTTGGLAEAGAVVRVVNVNDRPVPPPELLLDGVDAVIVLGGGDVDPALYGADGPVPNEYGVDRVADDALIALIHRTLESHIPYLGICRGSQILNVALGGTLVPDLDNWAVHRGATADTVFLEEDIALRPSSMLARIYGPSLRVKDGHHQAVDRLGDGLVAVGHAIDGVMEAVEHESLWAVGVQWHPEHPEADDGELRRLFDELITAASSRLEEAS